MRPIVAPVSLPTMLEGLKQTNKPRVYLLSFASLLPALRRAMTFAETPVQMVKGSIRLFVFGCFLENAVQEGRITPTSFREQIRLDEGGKGVDLKKSYTAEELKAETRNLILITLGITAISMNKALEVVFGKQFDAGDTSPKVLRVFSSIKSVVLSPMIH